MPDLELPLPVARLRRRSRNAKSAVDRHDAAYFALEASVRLAVAASPPADPAQLARGALGVWCAALRPHGEALEDPALLALLGLLTEEGAGKRAAPRSVRGRELLDALPAYRNRVVGHGSVRAGTYYEAAAGVLLAGLDAAWRNGLFAPPHHRLAFVESILIGADGGRRARVLELSGETPELLDRAGTAVPEDVLPHRLYLRDGERWRSLHPWLLFDEEREAVFCFNGLGRSPQFLDYASGAVLSGAALEELFPGAGDAVRALFSAAPPLEPREAPEPDDPARFGGYQLLGVLGEGGMGVVHLALQESLGRRVALKMLPPALLADQVALARFRREVRALARCEHAHVVKILDSGEARGVPYYAMEYVEGADLRGVAESLSRTGNFGAAVASASDSARRARAALFPELPQVPPAPPPAPRPRERWRALARYFRDAARGLQHLHERGIVHRDVSPGNLMATAGGERAVVMDLGLAALEGASASLTKTGAAVLGTLRYLAPEQLTRRLASVDPRADVYSLGAVMYELLAGRPMHDGDSEARLIEQVLREDPPPLLRVRPECPRDLALVTRKASEKDPAWRYGSAAEMAADLDAFLEGRAVSARPPSLRYQLGLLVRRNPFAAAAAAAAVLFLAAGLVVSLVFKARADENASNASHHESIAKANEARAVAGEQDALRQKSLAEEQDRLATQRLNDLLSLSASKDLEELVRRADLLWPPHPEMVEHYKRWLEDARVLLEGRTADPQGGVKARPGLAEHRRKLLELRAKAVVETDEARLAQARSHERYTELEGKRLERTWLSRMLGLEPWPSEAEVEASLSQEELPEDASALNALAWALVDPDAPVHGAEVKALLLARRAVAAAPDGERAGIRDTLAWALVRLGRLDEALEEEHVAAQESNGGALDASLARLERTVASWRDHRLSERRAELERLAFEIKGLELIVGERTLEQPEDGWWQGQLAALVSGLEALADPERGLMGDNVAAPHGWGVRRRHEFARTIAERSVDGAEAKARWDDAIAAVQASSKYGGLLLSPQMGLLPIGADPESGLWEFAHLRTGEPAVRGADGNLALTVDTGLVLVLIPGGSFWMGAQRDPVGQNYDPQARGDESPVHEVLLSAYYLSKYEMTQGQWKRASGVNPSRSGPDGDYAISWNAEGSPATLLQPVELVGWTDCMDLMQQLGLSLPSEAQWECGARGGTSWPWWSGEGQQSLQGAANLADAYARDHGALSWPYHEGWLDDGFTAHAPVEALRANAFGLHHVHGNVWEWCLDGYDPGFYLAAGSNEDPLSDPAGSAYRVYRGGGFRDAASRARSAGRGGDTPESRGDCVGLRPAKGITP